MMTIRSGALAAIVGIGTVLGIPGAGNAADGPALWEKNCVSCHGKDGKGDTKAGKLTKVNDLPAGDVRAKLTPDTVRQTVEQGVVDQGTGKTRMKGYKDKFSPDEIDALVKHALGPAGAAK